MPELSLPKELKKCGHLCFPSTTIHCCPCMDQRPMLVGDTYPMYTDGRGWVDEASRDAGYCPVCNPKNYEEWNKRIEEQRRAKAVLDEKLQREYEQSQRDLEADRARAAALFEYTNGDVYEGCMVDGKRNGFGRMIYHDFSLYEGDWVDDRQEGYGVKDWGDGIVYKGGWKNDMMHGQGHYTTADGTVMEGAFEEDYFMGA